MGELPPAIHYAYMEQDRDRNPAKRLELTADELSNLRGSLLEGIVLAQNDEYAQRDAHGAIDYSYATNSSNLSERYNKIASRYAKKKNWQKALEFDKKALELFPDNFGYNYCRAYVLDKLERYEETIPYWEKYLKLVKENWEERRAKKEKYTHKDYIKWAEVRLEFAKKSANKK